MRLKLLRNDSSDDLIITRVRVPRTVPILDARCVCDGMGAPGECDECCGRAALSRCRKCHAELRPENYGLSSAWLCAECEYVFGIDTYAVMRDDYRVQRLPVRLRDASRGKVS